MGGWIWPSLARALWLLPRWLNIDVYGMRRIEMAQWERDPVGVWSSPSYQELSKEEIEVRIRLVLCSVLVLPRLL